MSNGEIKITGGLNQTPKSVIVLFLDVGIFWHVFMIMPVSVLEHSKVASDCWQRRVFVR